MKINITSFILMMFLLIGLAIQAQVSKPEQVDYRYLLIPKGPAKTFKEHLVKTQVSDASLKALESSNDKRPFIMLNLVRFRPDRDPALYMKYGAVAGAGVNDQGSYTPYYASAIRDQSPSYGFDNSWDEMTMPVYSRLASYGLVQTNPAYQAALPDRVAGTYERLLYVLQDGEQIFKSTLTIQGLHDNRKGIPHEKTDVLIGEFVEFKENDGRKTYSEYAKAVQPLIEDAGGEVMLSVEANMPVVSEELWDHFILIKFPSMEAFEKMFKSDDFIEAGRLRREAIKSSIIVPTTQANE